MSKLTVESVQRAIDYIEEHLAETLSLEEISRASAMSVPNLYRLFNAVAGHPIKEYIRKRRASEAACLLRQTKLPSVEVGFRCGFDSYQTFVKTFKRLTGLTPGLYRKAEVIYSFERIRLNERMSYLEEREVSERYPDVKVIRLSSIEGIGYLHVADREEGLEEEALLRFQSILAESRIDSSQMRLFGWNVDLEEGAVSPEFGYQLMASYPDDKAVPIPHSELRPVAIPGGTYAITWTPMNHGPQIVAAWNRLLSEWLPLSAFELGEHGFLEEYQQFNGRISRMKLHLPVKRSQGLETIEVVEREALQVIKFQAEGRDSLSRADEAASEWIKRRDLIGDRRFQVLMSGSYGGSPNEGSRHKIWISLPDGYVPAQEDAHLTERLEGGLYACLNIRALGSMEGVLERIYRWLSASPDYMPDEERPWFASYMLDESGMERGTGTFEAMVSAACYVPVMLRNQSKQEEGP
ncbi:helix-turn-helix domain-containing protein [Paenibacillus nanensis]|uniref:helix-turn-helix domain-containing protein n=1 Tax=Paenibacillus nanensis TaxID=393251 RepID=UPI001F0C6FC9|nr:helix-turn-helix domain-containing protein [Paenibacillus nanensis]